MVGVLLHPEHAGATLDETRNTLIAQLSRVAGLKVAYLQSLSNDELVQKAMERKVETED